MKTIIPEIWLYEYLDCYVVSDSSNIITNTLVYIERIPEICSNIADYATGLVLAHTDRHATVNTGYEEYVDKAFFLGGNGSWNYYHWVVELLPKIEFFRDIESSGTCNTLLVPDECQRTEAFAQLLSAALRTSTLEPIYMKRGVTYKVGQLYNLTPPNSLVFNTRKMPYLPNYCYYSAQSLDYIRRLVGEIKSHFAGDDVNRALKRVFLARRSKIRNYNQEEVWEILRERGYVAVYMEEYSFVEQVRLFSNAKEIVGPTGAAWTNLVFCENAVKCICWMAEEIGEFSAYSTLAEYVGADMHYIKHKSKRKSMFHSDYVLDISLLEKALHDLEM